MDFPKDLDAVPVDARITEAFGLTPISFAVGGCVAMLGAIVGLVQFGFHAFADLYPALGCIAVIAVFGGYELYRRFAARYALAFGGHQIGVYRNGQLKEVIPRNHLGEYRLSIINTIREIFAYLAVGFVALIGTAMIFEQLMIGLFAIGAVLALGGGLVSSIYIRLMCKHVILQPSQTQLAFTKSELAKVGISF